MSDLGLTGNPACPNHPKNWNSKKSNSQNNNFVYQS